MFQFVSKSRTWIWRKLQKIVKIYSERFKTKKMVFFTENQIFRIQISVNLKKIAFFDKKK